MSRAELAIRQCAATWVEFGATIRNLTLAESIVARNEQAKMREPLASAEIPGLKFEHAGVGAEKRLAWEAGKFAAGFAR